MISKEKALALRQELGIPVVHKDGNVISIGKFSDEVADLIAPPFPSEARIFLETFHRTLNLTDAAEVLGISAQKHAAWLRHWPNYKKAFELLDEEITIALEDALHFRAFNGYREEVYTVDDEGNETLKGFKVKHDPQFLKTALAARKPEVYGKEGGTAPIQILIQQVVE